MKKRTTILPLIMTLSLILGGCSSNKTNEKSATSTSNDTKVAATATADKAADKPSDIGDKDRDGYILYDLCYYDAQHIDLTPDPTITVAKNGDTETYTYKEHLLSCGTHLTGTITAKKEKDKTIIKGDFNTRTNPYNIQKLSVDLQQDNEDPTEYTGDIFVDGRKLDVNWIK